ncbi:hypothetical protein KAR91_72320 [Candidatus Pacearchaeota archaeon]|nr:hypothetical protein [Candidatus Pacearchaeota archaeon]
MDSSPEPYTIITDKILSFLSLNIWPIIFLVFIIVFRGPLANLLTRIISLDFSFGNAKGALKATDTDTDTIESENNDSISIEKIEIDKSNIENEKIEEDDKKDDWFNEMHSAFLDNDYDKATSIFENWLKTESDEEKRIEYESIYLFLSYTKSGVKSSIERLKRLIETSTNNQQRSDPAFWLSRCYVYSKDTKSLEDLWKTELEESEEEFKTNNTINLASMYIDNNEAEKAYNLLVSQLPKAVTDQEKSDLYKCISKVEKERKNKESSALALEKAIEFSPDDKSILFDGAYAQSHANLEYLAFNNYDTLVTLDPNHSTALNNLGVSAKSLEMATMATKLYKKSAEQGNTLAMANLAQLYLNTGFLEDAKRIIEKARENEKPHKNVPKAVSEITSLEEKDKDRWSLILKKGNEFRQFIRLYTSAYFNEQSNIVDFSGHWTIEGQIQINIKINNDRLSAEWLSDQDESGNSEFKYSLLGTIHNNSAIITYKKESTSKTAIGLLSSSTITYNCFSYIDEESGIFHIKEKDPAEDFSMKLTRV